MAYSTFGKDVIQTHPVSVAVKVDERQVKNTQGLYVYPGKDFDMLRRFLILGTTAPTYHAGTQNVQKNLTLIDNLVATNGLEVVHEVFRLDKENLLIRKAPAIYVLAYALKKGDIATRKYVSENVYTFLRTGRDIAAFVEEVEGLGGGWGRLTRNAVSNWYKQPLNKVGYQVIKYRNTGQFEHRNILRLSHPEPETDVHNNFFRYIVGKSCDERQLPNQVIAFESLKNADKEEVVTAIKSLELTHEMIPTKFKSDPDVWEALAHHMPFRALVWNLGTFSRHGLLKPLSNLEDLIVAKLTDKEAVKASRIHPFTLLVGLRNYQLGKGERNEWPVNNNVLTALNTAFDLSLNNVENTGTKYGLIVDVSGSMSSDYTDYRGKSKNLLSGSNITPIEGAGAMAVIQSRQGKAHLIGVDTQVRDLGIVGNMPMSEVVRKLKTYRGYATNLGEGIEYFIENKISVDVIVFYTDNEVNQGRQPVQLFDKYKKLVNKDAKMVVVGFEANNFSIADSSRSDMLDICGFDMSAPQVIEQFIKGF